MEGPDERAFQRDLEDTPFRIGAVEGHWGLPDASLVPDGQRWPIVFLWVAAAPGKNSPDRYYFRLDCRNYPIESPTGTLCDPQTQEVLALDKRPKGRDRVAAVFRTDWEGGRALYHPYDRVAAATHPDWNTRYPHLVWSRRRSIVALLSELHALLNSSDYLGV